MYNFPRSQILVNNEKAKDNSSMGKKMAIICEALQNNSETKQMWIKEFKNGDSKFSFSELKSALYSLFPNNQAEQRQLYSEQFFKDMKWINDNKDDMASSAFARLAPLDCKPSKNSPIESFLNETKKLKAGVIKKLKIINQENQRCFNTVQLAQE